MRVGIDGYPLAEPRTGVGHYTLELARALAHISPTDQFELVSPKPYERTALDELERSHPMSDAVIESPISFSFEFS